MALTVNFWPNSSYSLDTPHPPIPRKGLGGAGFAKSICKILMAKGLGVKILRAKDLRA